MIIQIQPGLCPQHKALPALLSWEGHLGSPKWYSVGEGLTPELLPPVLAHRMYGTSWENHMKSAQGPGYPPLRGTLIAGPKNLQGGTAGGREGRVCHLSCWKERLPFRAESGGMGSGDRRGLLEEGDLG